MAKPYNEFEVYRAAALKAYRSAIRLKHSLAADAELAQVLPVVEAAIDLAMIAGEPLAIDPAQAFRDTL